MDFDGLDELVKYKVELRQHEPGRQVEHQRQ
jgi:hypothetical protein